MAHVSLLSFPASSMIGDTEAQLEAGDAAATFDEHKNRLVLAFDADAEEAAITPEVQMPAQFAGGTLVADVIFYTASDNTGNVVWEVFVEAKTPDVDTLDLETAVSWAVANSGTEALAGTTGDPRLLAITLTNKDSVAAGDLVRFGIRRDANHADDTITGDAYLAHLEIWEST